MLNNNKRLLLAAPYLLLTSMFLTGCGSDSDNNATTNNPDNTAANRSVNAMMINRVDNETGFLVAVDTNNDKEISNTNGIELAGPGSGLFSHNKKIYLTEGRDGDKVYQYRYENNQFIKENELFTGANVRPGSMTFVSNDKAYLTTYQTGELLALNLKDLTITKRIDLSSYALGDNDKNPEPSGGVMRDGKLYLALSQIDNFSSYNCQGGASLLIIDATTDQVEHHLQDNRTCSSGILEPNKGLILHSSGDIYVPNPAGYGYYGHKSGYLRIKAGATEFDPDYFFSISDLTIDGVPGKSASYPYKSLFDSNSNLLYVNLFIPGLTSNPPDYVNDKNYVLFKADLANKTLTKIDIPNTAGWSADMIMQDGKILAGRLATSGQGLFWYDPGSGTNVADQAPAITSQGSPFAIVNY